MRTRWTWASCVAIASSILICAAEDSHAGNLEPAGINLGATSFFDGFGRNEEGFVYLVYGQYGFARSVRDNSGNDLRIFNNPKINVFSLINQLVYVLPEALFDDSAHVGMDFLLPIVAFDTSFDPPPPIPGIQLHDNGVGVGDLTFGPFLQFRPTIAGGHPVFSHRIELDLTAPIGKYDPTKDINQGANFAWFNPCWALTFLPFAGFELSARLNYLYNFTNHRPAGIPPAPPGAPTVSSAQAGQAGWVNFAASYAIVSSFRFGVNGYYFQQFTTDTYRYSDGSENSGTPADSGKASFLGIGPGAAWDADQNNKLLVNFYFQTVVKNVPQSDVLNLHYIHSF
jgi:hypothetical protein